MGALRGDATYVKRLSTELTFTGDTITVANLGLDETGSVETLLVVDTAVYYEHYKGIWYPQNSALE